MLGRVQRMLTLSRLLFTPVAVGFLGYFAWTSREAVVPVIEHVVWPWLAAVLVLIACQHLLSPLVATLASRIDGSKGSIHYRLALARHLERLPARYLPGGVWQTVARMVDFHRGGMDSGTLYNVVTAEIALPLATTLILGGGAVMLSTTVPEYRPLGVAAVVAGFLVGHFSKCLCPAVPIRLWYAAWIATVPFWLVAATAFVSFMTSTGQTPADMSSLTLAGIYWLAWAVGFVTPFAPQGVGVFEFVAAHLLQPTPDFAATTTVLLGYRFATAIVDISLWLVLRLAGAVRFRQ